MPHLLCFPLLDLEYAIHKEEDHVLSNSEYATEVWIAVLCVKSAICVQPVFTTAAFYNLNSMFMLCQAALYVCSSILRGGYSVKSLLKKMSHQFNHLCLCGDNVEDLRGHHHGHDHH